MTLDIEFWHDFIQREKKQWYICRDFKIYGFFMGWMVNKCY